MEEQFETSEFRTVLKKIKDNFYYSNLYKGDKEVSMKQLAIVLSDIDKLKNFRLNTDWAQTIIHALSNESTGNIHIKSKKKGLGFFDSVSEDIALGERDKPTATTTKTKHLVQEETDLHSNEEPEETEEKLDVNLLYSPKSLKIHNSLLKKNRLGIKIIISEILESRGKKAFRQLLSPLLSNSKYLPELGMFHSAIMIGPWKLEWTDASLCFPKNIVSSSALIACDLTNDFTVSNCGINDMVDKIAHVIIKWNTTMEYKSQGGDGMKYGNCQDFVHAILDAINVDRNIIYQGAMGVYFERLKKKGKGEMKFFIDNDFRKKFSISSHKKHVKFTSHVQLDEFVNQLYVIDPLFDRNYPSEFKLLKSFDRAFWLRHNENDPNKESEPLTKDMQGFEGFRISCLNCPFGDPKENCSFRGY